MSTKLKIKAKSLAAEAKIIRKEERKALGYARFLNRGNGDAAGNLPAAFYSSYNNLRDHRRLVVRRQARLSHLARAIIKGQAYKVVEQPASFYLTSSDRIKIAEMVSRYGPVWHPKEKTLEHDEKRLDPA